MLQSNLDTSTVLASNEPLVTIITAVYNAEKYLSDCIKSVLNQSYRNIEYIIVDGGSTDGTLSIIEGYGDKITHWVSEPDKGIYDAWNKGLMLAKGEWIAFVGADDLLFLDAVQTYVQHIIQHPRRYELEFVSSRIELVTQNLIHVRTVGEAWSWKRFQKNMYTWHVGTFHSQSLFRKYGQFDSVYKSAGDYELLMRPKDQLVTSFVDKITAQMRTGGVSSVHLYQAVNETYDAKIKNGLLTPMKGQLLKVIDKFRLFMRSL